MLKRGIRINAICPGPTETPLAQANKEMWLGFGADYRGEVGIEASTPLEQAYPLVFLCSEAAAAINGITLVTDAGYLSSGITESFPEATMIARFLTGTMSMDDLHLDELAATEPAHARGPAGRRAPRHVTERDVAVAGALRGACRAPAR